MEKEVGVRATQVIKCTNSGSFNSDTSRKLGQAQANDPDIGPVYRFIESGTEKPNWSTVSNLSSDSKRLRLHIHEGILFRKWESTNGQKCWDQLILPMQYRDSVLEQLHDSVTGGGGGHLGFYRTLVKIQVGAPFERIAADIMGPFTTTDNDNTWLLVVGDYFTKYAVSIPLKDMTAKTVAQALIDNWVGYFGSPFEIHTDQGSNFDGTLFSETCRLLGIDT